MIKLKKIKVNTILGVIVGFFLATLVVNEGYAIMFVSDNGISYKGAKAAEILGVIIFIITNIFFQSKKIKKQITNKISVYLILSVVASIVVSMQIIMIPSLIMLKIDPNIGESIANNYFLSVNFSYMMLLIGIVSFLGVFIALVNKKVKYIKFLTTKVKEIKEEGFGKTIEVKGEDEISELCISINEMSVELREKIDKEKSIEKNKNELITNVSHDLRTPLTSMIGYIDLIKKNGFNDKEKFDEYINVIDERTRSLNKLINELFEYTKLNSHDIKLNYSDVEIGSLLEQIVGEYTPILKKEGLSVSKEICNEDIYLSLDIEKMVRVLENLLTNARKYSVPNTTIKINLFKYENDVVISIANITSNLEIDDLDNLFERFYKADKSRKDQESTGLGLSIVKRIVELHGGKVTAKLNNNEIEFIIRLPYRVIE